MPDGSFAGIGEWREKGLDVRLASQENSDFFERQGLTNAEFFACCTPA